jgi:hypothetical protein
MADNQDLLDFFKNLGEGGSSGRGPASEATLLRLEKALTGASGGGGSSAATVQRKVRQETETFAKTLKSINKSEKDATQKITAMSDAMRKHHRGVFVAGVGMKGLTDQVIGLKAGVGDFANVLDDAANVTGNLYIKALTQSFKLLALMVDKQVDNFKQMSEVGIQFSDGLFTTRELALQAGLTLDAFSDAVATSADSLALLSGSVRGGTERFASISKLFQNEFSGQAAGLGMTFEETTGLLTDYIEIQTAVGKSQFMSNRQLVNGAKAFSLELDLFSSITGKQRKQIADAIKQDMMDKRIQGIIQSLESSAVPGIQAILGSMQGLPSTTQDAIKELIGTGGIPLSDMAQSLVRLNPQLAGFAKRVQMGQGSVSEFESIIRQTAMRSQSMGAGVQRTGALLSAMGENTLAANLELFRFTEFGKQRNNAERDQASAMTDSSNQIVSFKNSLKDIQNFFIQGLLIPLEPLAKLLGNMARGLSSVVGFLTQSQNGFLGVVGGLTAFGIVIGSTIALTKGLGLAFSGLTRMFGRMMPSLGGGGAMRAAGGANLLGAVGPAVAKGGAFAGLGIGALLGLSGAGAGLGIAAIGKGLQTFNNVNAENLSSVADASQKLIATLVSGVTNPVDLTRSVSGLKIYAKTISDVLNDIDKDKLSVYTTKLEALADAFKEVNSSMSGAITTTGRTSTDKLDSISTLLKEIKLVMEDVSNSNKQISRKTANNNVYNT